jgi:TPR repeat protein
MTSLCVLALAATAFLQLVAPVFTLRQAQTSANGQEVSALEQKAKSGDAKAQVQLGLAYATGDGIPQNEAESVKWFRMAADQGDAGGEYYLSEMYATGRGVPVDFAEALKWLRKAADQGEAHAQYNLAAMYVQGLGVSKDDVEAAKWMRKAADQGLAAGQFGLGSMYAHGKGVTESASEAANWYRKAVEQGDPAAMNNLAYLLATTADSKVRNSKEAVAIAQRAVEAQPYQPAYLDTLATAYFEAGQPDRAVEIERQALALKPDDPDYKKALEKYGAASQHTGTQKP